MRIYLYEKIYEFNNAILNCKIFPRKIGIFSRETMLSFIRNENIFFIIVLNFEQGNILFWNNMKGVGGNWLIKWLISSENTRVAAYVRYEYSFTGKVRDYKIFPPNLYSVEKILNFPNPAEYQQS